MTHQKEEREKRVAELYEANRPRFHDWGTLKQMCIATAIQYADEQLTAEATRSMILVEENEKLKKWVSDLQSGMYVNCVYCGHRYGNVDNTPVSMADILKQHVEICPEHPMSKLKQQSMILVEALEKIETWTVVSEFNPAAIAKQALAAYSK